MYGSDAIAGVINFITRSDYPGAEVTGFYGSPTRGGGGEQWQGIVSAGWGDLTKDRWNVFIIGFVQRAEVARPERIAISRIRPTSRTSA